MNPTGNETSPRGTRLGHVYEQLEGVDPDDLRDALLAITEGAPAHLATADLTDPGAELHVGEDNVVSLEDQPAFERVINRDNQLPVHFLEEGVGVQKAVARVKLKEAFSGLPTGSGWGTGSLVSRSLLLTNNHVIPDEAFARKVAAEFNYQFDLDGNDLPSDSYNLDPNSFFRTNPTLDYTIVRVRAKRRRVPTLSLPAASPASETAADEPSTGDEAAPVSLPPTTIISVWRRPGDVWGHLPLPAGSVSYAVDQPLNVIGHPAGRRKEIALQENTITHMFTNVVHYTTDTEPGSSGSPVFTNGWDLIVLHHAAGHKVNNVWVDNEGMRIDRIVDDLRANAPTAIRTELGL